MSISKAFSLLLLAGFAIGAPARAVWAGDPQDPANFTDASFATGLASPTGLAWARDGSNTLFVTEKGGALRVIRNGTLQAQQVLKINVTTSSECGLLSVVTDPEYATNKYVFVFATVSSSIQRVLRFTMVESGGNLVASGVTADLTTAATAAYQLGPDLPCQNANHDGGGIDIGPDGHLYWGVGNLGNGSNIGGDGTGGQETSWGSKVGRLNRFTGELINGPNYNAGNGLSVADYYYARGFRNPFGLRFHPDTGALWMFEVGDSWEQIFIVTPGSTQGWPTENNTTDNAKLRPVLSYATNSGSSYGGCLTRGTWYTGNVFPASHQGNLFFCDYHPSSGNRIMRSTLNAAKDAITNTEIWITNAGQPTDITTGPDGALYYTSFGGSVRRVYYSGGVSAPSISAQPANRTVNDGQTAQFSVTATGTAPLTYQWQKMDPGGAFANITGATNSTYTTPATTLAMNGTQYRVILDNAAAGTMTSNAATLTVNANPPVISQQPANQTVNEGQTAQFSVAVSGSATLTYQWQKMDPGGAFANLAGATSSTYTTPATTAGMSGTQYRVILDNPAAGTVTSNAATLTVTATAVGPTITQQPAPQSAGAGQTAQFTVTATGTAPLAYQWQKADPGSATFADIAGATGAAFTTPTLTAGMNGTQYRVRVSNGVGNVTSNAAILTVSQPAAAAPLINPAGGTYSGPVTVRLSTTSGGAELRYTTDGSNPTGTSALYAGPLVLSASATLRAIATGPGWSNSPVSEALFTITGATQYGLGYRETVAGLNVTASAAGLPALLSGTGIFSSLATLTPAPGVVPFAVNSPLWSDNAAKQRWIALPGNVKVTFTATREWTFPTGTVLVKHFDLPVDDTNPAVLRRLETRVLYVQGGGTGYGATYRWNAAGTEATLMTELLGVTEDIPIATAGTPRTQTWFYPGRDNCMSCHNPAAGFVLGPKTRQLNGDYRYPSSGVTDNQLRTWNYLQMFATPVAEAQIPGYTQLSDINDAGASLEQRVRSYLDANCGNCHRPGGPMGRAQWDGRYDTPLAQQGLVEGFVYADTLGILNPYIVASSDPASSVLLSRMARTDTYRMPTLGSSVPHADALLTITAWINTLTAPGGGVPPVGGGTPPPGWGGGGGGTTAATAAPQGDDHDGVDEKCLYGSIATRVPGTGSLILALGALLLALKKRNIS